MNTDKILMFEVATLYYEKNLTQQQIADELHLTRQTVSKLLNDAKGEKIVEFIIHQPQKDCETLEKSMCEVFGIGRCVICSVSGKSEQIRQHLTVKAAVDYILPKTQKGNQKIASFR